MRKTIRLCKLIDQVNRRNRLSTCSPDTRRGWNSLLELCLHDSDAYNGFNYLTAAEIPPGQKPGIIPDYEFGKHEFPDETRRMYLTHHKLVKEEK